LFNKYGDLLTEKRYNAYVFNVTQQDPIGIL